MLKHIKRRAGVIFSEEDIDDENSEVNQVVDKELAKISSRDARDIIISPSINNFLQDDLSISS